MLAATPAELQLTTKRLNIRYFASLTADATEGSTPTATYNRAASVPYLFSAASSRRLLSSDNLPDPFNPTLDFPATVTDVHGDQTIKTQDSLELVGTAGTFEQLAQTVRSAHEKKIQGMVYLEDLHDRLEDHRSRRNLLQSTSATYVNTSDTEFLWMDLNNDNVVNIQDSLLFADMIKLVDSDPELHCTWLESVYSPSNATLPHSLVRGNSFTDASITGISSFGWQAVDPKLIYLRSNDSDVMYPDAASCIATGGGGAALEVPQLARFDGTAPLNEREFLGIVPGSETSDPAGLFKAFLRPDEARDWRMYTVRSSYWNFSSVLWTIGLGFCHVQDVSD